MWKLESIECRNVCAFKEFHYTLSQGVTTLIFGNNLDNENQRSNGSGKSALIEAIALGITGSPLRKVRGEEIINDNAEDCYIKLRLKNKCINEVFTIERELFRKGSSVVKCIVERDGLGVSTDETIQPSVDAYNKYILDKLGITRDELFNNFILSKHKYQDFLSASDRDKKEIINRFSNGTLVDEAIQRIIEDIIPLENQINEASLELAGIKGRVDILLEQISEEEKNIEENKRDKEAKITDMKNTITEKRALIRQYRLELKEIEQKCSLISKADTAIQRIEDTDLAVENCLIEIKNELCHFVIEELTDWQKEISIKKSDISKCKAELAKWEKIMVETSIKSSATSIYLDNIEKELHGFERVFSDKDRSMTFELAELKERHKISIFKADELKKENKI